MCVLEKEKELVEYSDLASEEKLTVFGSKPFQISMTRSQK